MANIILENDRLVVEIAEPGTVYRRHRFDWTGIVIKAVLDGKHQFISRELPMFDQCSGGYGLCSCYDSADLMEYVPTPVGDYYPRVGIGRVKKKQRDPFSIMGEYEIDPARMRWQEKKDSVNFTVEPLECNGYAFLLKKYMYLDGNTLVTEHSLTNTGVKAVMFDEFNHNYMMIDDYAVNGDYVFSVPYPLRAQMIRGEVKLSRYSLSVSSYDDFFYLDVSGFEGYTPHTWTVRHLPSGLGYSETLNQPVVKLNIWGCSNNFCPETFTRIRSIPGDTAYWKRSMTFF